MSESFIVVYGMSEFQLDENQKRIVCDAVHSRLSHKTVQPDEVRFLDKISEALLRNEDGGRAIRYIQIKGVDSDKLHSLSENELGKITVSVHQIIDEQFDVSVDSVAFANEGRQNKLQSKLNSC